MRRRARAGAALGAALLAAILPTTASASTGGGFTTAPDRGPSGTAITVSSTEPCPAPAAGADLLGVGVFVGDDFRIVASAEIAAGVDRSWSGSVTVPVGTRNGWYVVQPVCAYSDDSIAPYTGHEFVVTSPEGTPDPVVRISGADRIATAIEASRDLIPTGHVRSVVLSRADSYADALAGTPLATVLRAPLLLTGRTELDARVEAELQRVLEAGGEVHLLGGTAALSAAVADRVRAMGFTAVRYAGTNRYDTAVKVAATGVQEPTAVLLATGRDFRDGLVAGAAAPVADPDSKFGFGVVLLTDGPVLPPQTRDYLRSLGNVRRYAVGAEAAAADPSAERLVGTDHAATSVRVAERFFPDVNVVGLASSASFADALAGGAHVANRGEPLLLTDPGSLPSSVAAYLNARRSAVVLGFVYGGTAAVGDGVRTSVSVAIS